MKQKVKNEKQIVEIHIYIHNESGASGSPNVYPYQIPTYPTYPYTFTFTSTGNPSWESATGGTNETKTA